MSYSRAVGLMSPYARMSLRDACANTTLGVQLLYLSSTVERLNDQQLIDEESSWCAVEVEYLAK